MHPFRRGASALAAAILTLVLGSSSVAAGSGATVETFPLDARWSHEEPDGHVYWFDVTGDVRIVTTAGRQSATVHMREVQTLYDPSGKLVMEAKVASSQHALTLGEDTFQVHLTSRARWTNESGGGSYHVVLQIVNGVVVVDHTR